MSAGIKANLDGSGAIQVGGTDYIEISSTGAVAIPVSLTIGGIPAGGNYVLNNYEAPATWDVDTKKAAGLKAIKVTVVGGGGNGGTGTSVNPNPGTGGGGGGGGASIDYIPASSLTPSPTGVAITAGPGTNSFGAYCSATGGSNGANGPATSGAAGAGGTGSGGQINLTGQSGGTIGVAVGGSPRAAGNGLLGLGFGGSTSPVAGANGVGYGSGASGGFSPFPGPARPGGTGAPGIVIVEEFY